MLLEHSSISFLNQAHTAEIILFIHSNPGCNRTDIYSSVSRGNRMGDKIDMLISKGLVRDTSTIARFSSFKLTDLGEKVAEHLFAIEGLLG